MPDFQWNGDEEAVFISLSVNGSGVQLKPGETVTLDADPGIPGLDPVSITATASQLSDPAPAPSQPAVIPDVAGGDVAPSQTSTDAPKES